MKKLQQGILTLSTFVVIFGSKVLAIPLENPVSERYKDLISILGAFSSWVRPAAIVLLLGIIVWGGFVKLTAAGEQEKEKKAYLIIRAGLIGFTIIVVAPLIVDAVGAILGITLLST